MKRMQSLVRATACSGSTSLPPTGAGNAPPGIIWFYPREFTTRANTTARSTINVNRYPALAPARPSSIKLWSRRATRCSSPTARLGDTVA
jgi:hypothetical protein